MTIDLKIAEPHECEYCDAVADGNTVLVLTEAQRDVLEQILAQVDDAAHREQHPLPMSAAERDDVTEILNAVRPKTRHAGRSA